jgi:Transcriptional regulator
MDLESHFFGDDELSPQTPEDRIKKAALACIEETGLDGVTVRAIAAKAGQNVAAINYYFRSKDRLIDEALRYSWKNFMSDLEAISQTAGTYREKLELLVRFVVEGAYRYPKTMRAIVAESSTLRKESSDYFFTTIKSFSTADSSANDPTLGSIQLIAFGLLLGFAQDWIGQVMALDLSEESARIELTSRLSSRLFPLPAGE